MENSTQPVLFVSHGAPTIALSNGPAAQFLSTLGDTLQKPKAIVVFSAHLDTRDNIEISAGPLPELVYDFYGFPQKLYEIEYPAKGAPELAGKIAGMLESAGIAASQKPDLGWDHGVWIPLSLMYPDADIPVVEVSIRSRLGAAFNFKLGEVLAPLREAGVLMIGSGGISHNLREIFASPRDPSGVQKVEVFTEWVAEKLISGDYQSVVEYESLAPHASYNHPTSEHFYPLMTVLGASGNAKAERLHHSVEYDLLAMDAYRFG